MEKELSRAHFIFDEEMRIWRRQDESAFGYSDGDDAEKSIYDAIKQCRDRSVHSDELRPLQNNWVLAYHLSALRSNLLRPLEAGLLSKARVLELGCGCGAVTRYLGEVAPEVIAVEGSARRAAIAALRCEGLENVTVVAEKIENIPESIGKFDVVTIIGVLEYARIYGGGKGAELRLLETARSFLRPGGVLILAIENKLGLKYFAGVPEDHLGIAWSGVMNTYTQEGVATYSRKELDALLSQAGFGSRQQFVSFPDYKLPITVIHPEGLVCEQEEFRQSSLMTLRTRFYEEPPLFNTQQTWESICNAGLLPEMADSLCFTAVNDKQETEKSAVWDKDILASHYGFCFKKQHAKEVLIKRQPDSSGLHTTRRALFPPTPDSAGSELKQQLQNESYVQGPLLIEYMRHAMLHKGWTIDRLLEILRPWVNWIISHKTPETGKVPFHFIDAAPFNIIVGRNNELTYIDQEWNSGRNTFIHVQSIMLRTLINSFQMIGLVARPEDRTPLNIVELTSAIINRSGFPFTGNEEDIIEQAFYLDCMLLGIPVTLDTFKPYQLQPIPQNIRSLYPPVQTALPEMHNPQQKQDNAHKIRLWKLIRPLRSLRNSLQKSKQKTKGKPAHPAD